MTEKQLKNGEIIKLSNEKWCIENQSDFQLTAEASFSNHLDRFIIWFNGELVHSSKTFKSMMRKLNQLITKYYLT